MPVWKGLGLAISCSVGLALLLSLLPHQLDGETDVVWAPQYFSRHQYSLLVDVTAAAPFSDHLKRMEWDGAMLSLDVGVPETPASDPSPVYENLLQIVHWYLAHGKNADQLLVRVLDTRREPGLVMASLVLGRAEVEGKAALITRLLDTQPSASELHLHLVQHFHFTKTPYWYIHFPVTEGNRGDLSPKVSSLHNL